MLTSNVADFPAAGVGQACRVLHPGALFGEFAGSYPIELARVIAEMAAHCNRPPMTPDDILDRLGAVALHTRGDALRQRTDGDHGCLLLPAMGPFAAETVGKCYSH